MAKRRAPARPDPQLEALTARAIRAGKSLRGLVNELLAAAADQGR